jgi:hypothetical protein
MEERDMLQKLAACTILGALMAALAMPQDADPPRRAARVGYASGAVTVQPAGVEGSTPAEINRPITTGDRFWTEAAGRGELQTDNAAMRFDGRTSFLVEELDSQATQIQITAGTLSVRLHALAPHEVFEVDTPHLSFNLLRLGQYRVDVNEQGDASITVRFGEAEGFSADGSSTPIHQGMEAGVTGSGRPRVGTAPPTDPFDAWCIERDRREDLSASAHYVSRDLPGYADLDEYGAWRTVGQYGAVWFPGKMDAAWAPYKSGHFIWTDSWGMNWVDTQPWGFVPSHYGRWVKVDGSWGWVPGTAGKTETARTFAVRPYYAPALVAWASFDAGVVLPDAVVGWFPLGPGEAWKPGFPVSADYIARVNSTNTVIVDPVMLEHPDVTAVNYMNRETAMTAMRHDDLAAGRPAGGQFVEVPRTAYARAVVSAQPDLQPTQEARIGPRGPAQGAPLEIANRSVVAHRAPPRLTPFAQRTPAPQPAARSMAPAPRPAADAQHNVGAARTTAPVKHPGGTVKSGGTHPPVPPKTKPPKKS